MALAPIHLATIRDVATVFAGFLTTHPGQTPRSSLARSLQILNRSADRLVVLYGAAAFTRQVPGRVPVRAAGPALAPGRGTPCAPFGQPCPTAAPHAPPPASQRVGRVAEHFGSAGGRHLCHRSSDDSVHGPPTHRESIPKQQVRSHLSVPEPLCPDSKCVSGALPDSVASLQSRDRYASRRSVSLREERRSRLSGSSRSRGRQPA